MPCPWFSIEVLLCIFQIFANFLHQFIQSIVHRVPIQQLNVAYALPPLRVAEGDPNSMEMFEDQKKPPWPFDEGQE